MAPMTGTLTSITGSEDSSSNCLQLIVSNDLDALNEGILPTYAQKNLVIPPPRPQASGQKSSMNLQNHYERFFNSGACADRLLSSQSGSSPQEKFKLPLINKMRNQSGLMLGFAGSNAHNCNNGMAESSGDEKA